MHQGVAQRVRSRGEKSVVVAEQSKEQLEEGEAMRGETGHTTGRPTELLSGRESN